MKLRKIQWLKCNYIERIILLLSDMEKQYVDRWGCCQNFVVAVNSRVIFCVCVLAYNSSNQRDCFIGQIQDELYRFSRHSIRNSQPRAEIKCICNLHISTTKNCLPDYEPEKITLTKLQNKRFLILFFLFLQHTRLHVGSIQ